MQMGIFRTMRNVEPMDEDVLRCFPKLDPSKSAKTSEANRNYNCIAWAAERGASDSEWWWPDPSGSAGFHWPDGVEETVSLGSFIQAFHTLGYESCANGNREAGLQKVVVFVDERRRPTHMARQLEDGRWTSKLGQHIDIVHSSVDALEGRCYGKAVQYMKRRRDGF